MLYIPFVSSWSRSAPTQSMLPSSAFSAARHVRVDVVAVVVDLRVITWGRQGLQLSMVKLGSGQRTGCKTRPSSLVPPPVCLKLQTFKSPRPMVPFRIEIDSHDQRSTLAQTEGNPWPCISYHDLPGASNPPRSHNSMIPVLPTAQKHPHSAMRHYIRQRQENDPTFSFRKLCTRLSST